ncbi:MAG: hypothetical protein WD638_12145 [Nitriliruptoraceae bacterium]
MSQQTQDADEQYSKPRSRLAGDLEGRTVGFWLLVAVAIAVVVLGIGSWWVWGLARGMPMDGDAMDEQMGDMGEKMGMEGMPHTDVRLPPVAGFYDGQQIFFVHPEASDAEVAEALTEMMGGSPVLVVPELAEVAAAARDDVYVFANGLEGMGPLGFQPDVFASVPGDDDYSPLRTVVEVSWNDDDAARELTSADEVEAAADAGEVELTETDVVVNMPVLTWPEGAR